jgi:hypothetical protein
MAMANPKMRLALVAALYGAAHYASLAEGVVRVFGMTEIPHALAVVFETCFVASLVIIGVAIFAMLLKLNIFLSRLMLGAMHKLTLVIDRGLERFRAGIIASGEAVVEWMKGGESPPAVED